MIVRLGAPGVVHAVVVDTAHFTGNFPQACSVEACWADGYPDLAALDSARWVEIVGRSPLKGDTPHVFEIPPRPGTGTAMCGCGSTPTAGSRGCGCTGWWCPTRRCSRG